VTSERIRDKIAASKKGMWMGGVPPLGYMVRDRKLIVVEREAESVRHTFRRYAALGSVRPRQQELQVDGIPLRAGRALQGDAGAVSGALYLILT
jgi:site-specific DNA recombinase